MNSRLLLWIFFFFLDFSSYGPFLKCLLNLLKYCFCFYGLVFCPRGMWDLSSLTRDQACTRCPGTQRLNRLTARKVLDFVFLALTLKELRTNGMP